MNESKYMWRSIESQYNNAMKRCSCTKAYTLRNGRTIRKPDDLAGMLRPRSICMR